MTEWNSLFQHYEAPPYVLPHTSGAYSFGIAGGRGPVCSPLPCKLSRTKTFDRWCLQALELESPSTGTVQDLLRSSMGER